MKKTLICLILALVLVFSTAAAVFAVDDMGGRIRKNPVIVRPMVDDMGG